MLQVAIFMQRVGKQESDVDCHMDASGLKKLFSHGLRRWLSGASTRAARPIKSFIVFFCFPVFFFLLSNLSGNTRPCT